MKNLLTLGCLIISPSVFAQQSDLIHIGVITSPLAPVMNKSGVGLTLGAMRQKKNAYFMGFNFDVLLGSKSRSIDIPNNLLAGESIDTNFKTFTLNFANRFDLTPSSRAKLFADANIGVRYALYESTHIGYLILKMTENIYKKSSGGLSAQLFLGLLVPLNKQNSYYLALKTGVAGGSTIRYIDDNSISYDANTGKMIHGPAEETAMVFWQTSVDFVARLDWPKYRVRNPVNEP